MAGGAWGGLLLLSAVTGLCQAAYFSMFSMREPTSDPCSDGEGRPVRCVPDFINAAFGKPVVASSTCGLKQPQRFCYLDSGHAKNRIQEKCEVSPPFLTP